MVQACASSVRRPFHVPLQHSKEFISSLSLMHNVVKQHVDRYDAKEKPKKTQESEQTPKVKRSPSRRALVGTVHFHINRCSGFQLLTCPFFFVYGR